MRVACPTWTAIDARAEALVTATARTEQEEVVATGLAPIDVETGQDGWST